MLLGEIVMQLEVMEHFGIKKYFRDTAFFETDQQKRIFKQLKKVIPEGQLIALTGVVGVGKTTMLSRLQCQLNNDKKVIVAKSLSVEKSKTNLGTLITALFYDVSGDNDYRVPKQGEKRERELQDLIKNAKKPIVLFVDEAHDLHHRTLTGLKRLMEVIQDGGGKLSILLAGHPKLQNDLKSPSMEEVGYRTITISLDSLQDNLKEYVYWLLNECGSQSEKVTSIIEEQAIDYLAEKLSTPLQIEQHLTMAMEEGYKIGIKPITTDLLDITLSKHIDDIEPILIRHGYNEKAIIEQFHYRPAEIRKYFRKELDSSRLTEITREMREAGLPI